MSDVQAKLSYYLAWTRAESEEVGAAYAALVAEVRRIAGEACRVAWSQDPASQDSHMNISRDVIDLSELQPLEDAYIAATKEHLSEFLRIRRLFRMTH